MQHQKRTILDSNDRQAIGYLLLGSILIIWASLLIGWAVGLAVRTFLWAAFG